MNESNLEVNMAAAIDPSTEAPTEVTAVAFDKAKLEDLKGECTCIICQDVYKQPLRLSCTHIFCKECISKVHSQSPSGLLSFMAMLDPSGEMQGRAKCPCCRSEFQISDAVECNEKLELLQELYAIKTAHCCQNVDCWEPIPGILQCKECGKRLCDNHHEEKHRMVINSAKELRDELKSYVNSNAASEQLVKMIYQHEALPMLKTKSKLTMDQIFTQLEHQLNRTINEISQHNDRQQQQLQPQRQQLSEQVKLLDSYLSKDRISSIRKQMVAMKPGFDRSHQRSPPRVFTQQLALGELSGNVAAVFRQLEPVPYVDAYTDRDDLLVPFKTMSTRQEPWDIDILSNTTGLMIVANQLVICNDQETDVSDSQQLQGPCLVVNFKGFATEKLHLTSMDGEEIGGIKINFNGEGMPGMFRICNQRQLICTSDAGRHKVFILKIDGSILHTLGSEGNGPEELCSPLGVCFHSHRLYVTDSKNKRLQVYDAGDNFRHVKSITHSSLSDGMRAVQVTDNQVIVLEGLKKELVVLDAAKHELLRTQQLEGHAFNFSLDRYNNILVSIFNEAKVQAFNPDCSMNIKTFELKSSADDGSRSGIRQLRGMAVEPQSNRIFLSDTFRQRIYLVDL